MIKRYNYYVLECSYISNHPAKSGALAEVFYAGETESYENLQQSQTCRSA